MKFHENPSSRSRTDTADRQIWTDGGTDMTKIICGFREYAKGIKMCWE